MANIPIPDLPSKGLGSKSLVPLCLNLDDAATHLGISRRMLQILIGDGEIQSIKVGRRRLVPLSALEDFVERKLEGGEGR
jgi:excisionase family DNA binding protein